ncbi:MAG: hypothetical protein KAW66_06005 [Candidatus Lokiarchaeota archaeon]|nr:hypothetical protein [Candidatus Lokiarchaeota archaeon]
MSQRFKKFVERVAKDNEFKPLKNKLLYFLQKESEQKYKNYPRLLELMQSYWPKYKEGSRISYLLKDHYEEIFYFYLNTIFPFRKQGLTLSYPEAPTPVDFKLIYNYHYNLAEIQVIEDISKQLKIDTKTESILKRILIFTVSSFSPMIQQIFRRPFAFQFSSIDANQFNNGEWEVDAIISAREQ